MNLTPKKEAVLWWWHCGGRKDLRKGREGNHVTGQWGGLKFPTSGSWLRMAWLVNYCFFCWDCLSWTNVKLKQLGIPSLYDWMRFWLLSMTQLLERGLVQAMINQYMGTWHLCWRCCTCPHFAFDFVQDERKQWQCHSICIHVPMCVCFLQSVEIQNTDPFSMFFQCSVPQNSIQYQWFVLTEIFAVHVKGRCAHWFIKWCWLK